MTVVIPAAVGTARQLSVVVASKNAVKVKAVAAALRQALPGVAHHVTGSESRSEVPDQPFGDEETLLGAFNRIESIRTPQHRGSLLVAIEGGVGHAAPLPPPPAAMWQQQAAAAELAAQRGTSPPHLQQQQHQQQSEQQLQQRLLAPGWHELRRQYHGAPAHQQLPALECFAWVVVQAPSGASSHARTASFPLPLAVTSLMLRQGLELGAADDAVFGRVKSGRGSGTIGQLTGGLITRQLYYEHAVLCALVPLMNPQLYPEFAGLPDLQPPLAAEQTSP